MLARRDWLRWCSSAVLLGCGVAGVSAQEPGDGGVLAEFTVPGVEPKGGAEDSPLPVGYPDATRPGVIEVKTYPAYRSAVAKGERMSMSSGDALFWSLFRHIERNEIAMTAPVINTYPKEMAEDPKARGEVAMEFLYREPTMGKVGKDGAQVEVVDMPAGQFVCLGVQGGMSEKKMRAALDELGKWLEAHKGEWVEAGPPRRLGYHGPMTPTRRRLWEVQIPVKPAGGSPEPAAEPGTTGDHGTGAAER
jgi:hypothetical protein